MRRKDMEAGVIYAILTNGMPRPGYVISTGNPVAKIKDVKVKVAWSFPGSNDDLLQEAPDLLSPLTKWDDGAVGTADVLCRWDVYCRNVKADRQARLDKLNAEEAAAEAEKRERLSRLRAVAHLFGDFGGYCDYADVKYLIANDREYDTRYSAMHILQLAEYIATRLPADTGVSQ